MNDKQKRAAWFSRTGVAIFAISLAICASSGCQATIPTIPHGVLSTIHQKCLARAAERALDQADVTRDTLGKQKVFLTLEQAPDTDLGKQHVRRVVHDRFRSDSAGLVESGATADRQVTCQILLAGVDVTQGALLGFRWLDTKAEVQLRVTSGGDAVHENNGTGTAVYRQLWWLGIGPTEKLK